MNNRALQITSPDLQAALLVMSRSSKELQQRVRKATQRYSGSWQSELRAHMPAGGRGQLAAIADSGRVTTTSKGVKLVAGSVGKLSGSGGSGKKKHPVPIRQVVRQFEFGGNRNVYETYNARSSKTGHTWVVDRRLNAVLPWKRPKGYMVYPALEAFIPVIASAWVGAVVEELRKEGF